MKELKDMTVDELKELFDSNLSQYDTTLWADHIVAEFKLPIDELIRRATEWEDFKRNEKIKWEWKIKTLQEANYEKENKES